MKDSNNFFGELERQHLQKQPVKGKNSSLLRTLVPVLALMGAIGAVIGTLWVQDNGLRGEIGEIESYISDPDVAAEYAALNGKLDSLQSLNDYAGKLRTMRKLFATYPALDEKYLEQIWMLRGDGVTIRSFAFTTDTITLSCVAAQRDEPADFADALSDSDLFRSVGYDGFTQDDSGYVFELTCVMKGGDENAAE